MKSNLERSKWFPLFIMAVILLFIYNLMGNFTSVTSEIMRFLSIISPLLYGILFSYFLYMPHQLFERLMRKTKVGFIVKRARIFATLLTLVFMLGVLVLVISFLLPVLITSVFDLATSIPGYVAFVTSFLNNLPEEGFWAYFDVLEVVTDNAGAMLAQVFNAATIESFAMGIISFASQLLNIVLGLIISLYVLLERERIGKFLKAMSKALFRNNTVRRNRVNRYMDQIHKVLFTFIASKGLDSIINFVVVTTMLLIFDVPY
ncbi:MAG: AI-2E family transporter, partial [Oscillospiraceae bacterium]|nr:AI-2E family transporter [Oscillospiraceae bacterium]